MSAISAISNHYPQPVPLDDCSLCQRGTLRIDLSSLERFPRLKLLVASKTGLVEIVKLRQVIEKMERETGLEPATVQLGKLTFDLCSQCSWLLKTWA